MSDFQFTSPGSPDEKSSLLDVDDPIEERTVLDGLREALQKKVQRPDIELEVPERPGVTVRFSPNITHAQVMGWRKKAGVDSKSGLDQLKFSCMIIGHTCTAILFDGKVATDESGNRLTFASQQILDWLGVDRPITDGIRAFYGVDPHVDAVAGTIIDKAGWGEDIGESEEPKDPQIGS